MSSEHDKRLRDMALGKGDSAPPPAPPTLPPPTVKLSQQQIEEIAEAVANRVVAKLKEEPK
jgi:hypothetical protein